jgi:cobaltochelatase CobS
MARPSRFTSTTTLAEIVATISLAPGALGETRFYDASKSARYAALRLYVENVCGLPSFATWDQCREAYDSAASQEFYREHHSVRLQDVQTLRAMAALDDLGPGITTAPPPTDIRLAGNEPDAPSAAVEEAALETLWTAVRAKADKSAVPSLKDIEHLAKAAARVMLDDWATTHAVTRVDLTLPDLPDPRSLGVQHKCFPDLLRMTNARRADGSRLNIWLPGPAGSGKTRAAEECSKALGLDFSASRPISYPEQVLGNPAIGDKPATSTDFERIYTKGGVFLFDEVDAGDPNATLDALNAALANGFCPFAGGLARRHPDCVIIAAANTWGQGGTAEYVGRMKHDAALLSRFVKLPWPYDEALERTLCANEAWCDYVQHVRRNVLARGLKVAITPRASYDGASLLAAGVEYATVCAATLREGMSDAQWDEVR